MPALPSRARCLIACVAAAWMLLAAGSAQAATVSVSGSARFDESGRTWSECDGTTANVALSVNGAAKQDVPCDKVTGAFTFSAALATADVPITVFLDPASPGGRGMTVTRNANTTSSITGLTVVQDRVLVRSESATAPSNAMFTYTSSNDPDVPVTTTANACGSLPSVSLGTAVALLVDTGVTFTASCDVTAWMVSVRSSATFNAGQARTRLYGSGQDTDCTLGTGVSMPLCLSTGGTFVAGGSSIVTYQPADGRDVAVPPVTFGKLEIQGNALNTSGRVPHAVLGTGVGQTVDVGFFTAGFACGTSCPEEVVVDSGTWAPSILSGGIDIARNARWEGSRPFTIQSNYYFVGAGAVDLPAAALTLAPSTGFARLGPGGWAWEEGEDWNLGSVTISSTYTRASFGAGSGVTTAWNSAGTQNDVAAGVVSIDNGSGRSAVLLGTQDMAGASRGFVTQWWSDDGNAAPAACGASPQTATWNSGLTADTALGIAATGWGAALEWGTNGSNGGDGTVRRVTSTCGYDDAFGTLDSPDVGTGKDFVSVDYDGNAVGYDDARMAMTDGAYLDVAGTFTDGAGSNTRDFGAVRYTSSGAALGSPQRLIWNSAAGAADNVSGGCYDFTYGRLYLIGTIPSSGGDLAVKAIDTNSWTWVGYFGNADLDASVPGNDAFVYNSGGANADAGVACSVFVGSGVFLTGTANVAGNTSTVIIKTNQDGVLETAFGTAGVATFDMAAGVVETPRAMVFDEAGVIVAGRSSANGGDEFLTRFDADGDLDTTFWIGGGEAGGPNGDGVLVPSTAATDSSAAGLAIGADQRVFVARSDGSTAGGDISLEGYDAGGDLRTSPDAPGRTRIIGQSGHTGNTTTFSVGTDVTLGTGAGTSGAVLDLESFDLALDIGDALLIKPTGAVRASSSQPLHMRNDFTNNGRFTANSGLVDISGSEFRSSIKSVAASGVHNSFYRLRIVALPGTAQAQKIVAFNTVQTTRITNSLVLTGSDCTGRIGLTAVNAGTPATIDTTGATTRTINYADFTDITLTPAGSFANVNLVSGTSGVTATAPCAGSSLRAPNGMYSDDTDTQVGTFIHSGSISTQTPHLSWFNRTAGAVKEQTRVYSDVVDGDVLGLWHLDGAGTNVALASPTALTLDVAPNTPNWTAAAGGRFSQGLNFAGSQRATIAATATHDTRTFTVDAWFRTSSIAGQPFTTIVERHSGTNEQFEVGFDRALGTLYGEVRVAGVDQTVTYPAPAVVDGAWHHVALANAPTSASGGRVVLFVDGRQVDEQGYIGASDIASGQATHLGNSPALDCPFVGQLDEVRIVGRALAAPEVRGWYRTGRPHGDLIWDSSPSGTGNAFTGGVTLGYGGRSPDIVFGGPAGSLVLDGARYYAQTRFADSGGTFVNWSAADWFETRSSLTLTTVGAPTVSLGSSAPGADVTGSASFQVTTSAAHGYSLQVTSPVDGRGLWSGSATIAPWSGAPGAPTSWPAATAGFGITTLSATGGKDTARWGAGSLPSDIGTLKYAGPMHSLATNLHTRSTYSAATDTIVMGVRATAPNVLRPGAYTTALVVTAVANP